MKPSSLEMGVQFQAERPTMAEASTTVWLWTLLQGELKEAEEVLDNPELLIYEMADIILFSSQIIANSGRNPEEVVREKVGRNNLKMPAIGYQNGTPYSDQIRVDKKRWADIGGDEEFFQ